MNTDESALPVSEEQSRGKVAGVYGGMTLHDVFAACALIGMMANDDFDTENYADRYARDAYMVADAMLKARNEGATQ